ncbi:MAG: hydrogenase maturation nickel metallochaperone HypA [Chloroflexi bacterium]|nr:hydrogenase maturation nickel metallochaperone HypA [Chloroflexota bacterium]MBI3170933.1 hydrogenase maturation nickel metallochaperone HypA [Chloroflexota bacterium]
MHELSIAESILNIALCHAEKVSATRISDIHLVIGKLSYVMDDSVQFYWDTIAKDTIAEGARLHFKRVPAELLCLDCSQHYAPDGETLACPNCQSTRVKVVAGEEFRIESIDVETPSSPSPLPLGVEG